jgi:hypothetical protein
MISHDVEVYALGTNRSADFARKFLDRFLPDREAARADGYPVPELIETELRVVYQTAGEVLDYLECHREESYGLYFRNVNPKASPKMALLFHTTDGKVIFGLVVWPEESIGYGMISFTSSAPTRLTRTSLGPSARRSRQRILWRGASRRPVIRGGGNENRISEALNRIRLRRLWPLRP